MTTYMIILESVNKVRSFVNAITGFNYAFEIISGSYSLNAKSIMGIFALDLNQPLELRVHVSVPDPHLESVLEPYLYKQ